MVVRETQETAVRQRYPIHSLLYSRGEKVFHIAAEIEDVPGSLNSLLELVSGQIDLRNTISFSHDKGLASWRAFATAVNGDTTAETLKLRLQKSPFVRDVEVTEGKDGLVVNKTTSGPSLGPGEPLIVLSVAGMNSVFDQVVRVFGTGGESILYGQGHSLGQANGRYLKEYLGNGFVKHSLDDLAGLYSSFGWGIIEVLENDHGATVTGRVRDCFECASGEATEARCNFFLGHFKGIVSTLLGVDMVGTEKRCKKRGNEFCEFELRKSVLNH
ncbi:MAG TPA: V4R domain-containing protein [Nitrososphaerales archaeon]|nr:V4R domain-containing protein [Nitrososphaerales archaeon]